MISFYSIFHGNLQFSSIPKSRYKTVINNCYRPLIKLLEKNEKIKIGIEFSALTLLEIQRIDVDFLKKLMELIRRGQIEFVGSSYTQTIFPLIPYKVNLKNLQLGIKIYKNILGQIPEIFYVNEQTFSDGLISLYKEARIKNIIVDFDSAPDNVRLNKSLLYQPVKIISQEGEKLTAIWTSSIAFQKFQRYIFDEISFEDYWQYLSGHLTEKVASFCLYAGDLEVFGYSPKGINRNFNNDFKRIELLFAKLLEEKQINFILPKQVLTNKIRNKVRLTGPSSPICSKKQEKYNVSRWALAGKNTIFRNTDCFKLLRSIKDLKSKGLTSTSIIENLEKNLIVLWGSDYRTNTAADKNREYDDLLVKTQVMIKRYMDKAQDSHYIQSDSKNLSKKLKTSKVETWETKSVKLTLDWRKGASIKELTFPEIFPKRMAGLVTHGYFQNQQLSSDWFSGHCLFETDSRKYTDLYPTIIFVDKNRNDDINLYCEIKTPIGTIKKNYKVYQDLPRVDLQYVFNLKKVGIKSARVGNVTIDPVNFDNNSLWYATVNGGKSKEVYKICNSFIAQDEIVSFRISSKGCLGATEGWLAIGDKYKALALVWDKSELASCPLIHFEKTQQGLFARIQPSIAESDETGFQYFKGRYSFGITYLGLKSLFELDRYNFTNKIIKR